MDHIVCQTLSSQGNSGSWASDLHVNSTDLLKKGNTGGSHLIEIFKHSVRSLDKQRQVDLLRVEKEYILCWII